MNNTNNDEIENEYYLNIINIFTFGIVFPVSIIFFNYISNKKIMSEFDNLKIKFIIVKKENDKLKKDIKKNIIEINKLIG